MSTNALQLAAALGNANCRASSSTGPSEFRDRSALSRATRTCPQKTRQSAPRRGNPRNILEDSHVQPNNAQPTQ